MSRPSVAGVARQSSFAFYSSKLDCHGLSLAMLILARVAWVSQKTKALNLSYINTIIKRTQHARNHISRWIWHATSFCLARFTQTHAPIHTNLPRPFCLII